MRKWLDHFQNVGTSSNFKWNNCIKFHTFNAIYSIHRTIKPSPFQNHSPSPFLKILLLPTLTDNSIVKLSSKNTIHILFDFRVHSLKCMVDNVYINKTHAMQCLHISLYYGEVFSTLSISLLHPKESFRSNLKNNRKENIVQWSNFQWK